MPVLVLHPRPNSEPEADAQFRRFLSHMQKYWPGTLLLVATCETPKEGHIESTIDWVRLPGPNEYWQDRDGLVGDMLEVIIRRYEIPTAIGIGAQCEGLIGMLKGLPLECLALPVGGEGDGFGQMDGWLARVMPVEIVADQNTDIDDLLGQLEGHAAWNSESPVLLRWRGRSSRILEQLIKRLCEQTSAPIDLRLLSSYYFQVPRSGSSHTLGDLLFRATAWGQMLSFVRLISVLPGQVDVRVRTLSRKRWIHRAVELANLGTRWFRATRRRFPGGGR